MSLPPIFALLAASPAVTALIGTAPMRLFPSGNIPQAQVLPAVTWQSVGGLPENQLADRPVVDNMRTQIDCWALDYPGARALFVAVQAAVELNATVVSLNGDDYDEATKRYRTSFDVSWWVDH